MNDSQTVQPGRTRRRTGLIALVLLAVIVVAALLEPTGIVRGYLHGETFFQGRPESYWADALAGGPAEKSAARQSLVQGGEASVPVLVKLLSSHEAEEVRWTAAEMLGILGPDAHEAANALLSALNDSDPYVQSVAVEVIPKVDTPAAEAVPALTPLLESEHAPVVARALSVYKAQAAPAIPELTAVLTDTSRTADARWNAARTIGKIGPPAIDALPILIEMTRDNEPTVRGNAAEAIGDIGPTAVEGVPALIGVLDDPAFRVRQLAVRSLGYIGPAAREAVPHIKPLLADPEESVCEAAKAALQAIAPEEAGTEPVDEDPPVRLESPEDEAAES